jgi:hypothetical protein
MYQRSIFSMLVVGLAFGTAQAAETNRSEFFYQPGAGQSDVTVHVGYEARNTTAKNVTTESKLNGWAGRGVGNAATEGMGVGYEYGLNEMLSLGADVSFVSLETDATPKFKTNGLADPMLFVHGTSGMDFGRLRYGANLGLGFSKQKIETDRQDAMTGGFSLTPYIGLDLDAGPGILGGRVSYRFNMERTLEGATGAESKVKDGNMLGLAAFYEYMLSDMLLGVDVNYRMVGEATTTTAGVNTTSKTYSPLGADLYARIPLDEMITIIPSFGYDFSASGDVYDKYNDMTFQIAARFGF